MKWIKIGGKKEPKFGHNYLIYFDGGKISIGRLLKKIQTGNEVKFVFWADSIGEEANSVTHFIGVTEPED